MIPVGINPDVTCQKSVRVFRSLAGTDAFGNAWSGL
jgi:hypothetical protein